MLAHLSLKRPCPWCGIATAVPPATPFADLARWSEARCNACQGGVRARASWLVFLAFVGVYGAVSNLLLWCLGRSWSAWQDGAPAGGAWSVHAGWIALVIAGFVIVSLMAQRFLVGASILIRGKPPRGRGGW